MPIYEYGCKACGHQLETMQKFSDEPLTICPKCNQATLAKLVSSSSFHLKGGGWYVTDIRDKDKPKPKDDASTADQSAKESSAKDNAPVNDTKSSGSTGTDKT